MSSTVKSFFKKQNYWGLVISPINYQSITLNKNISAYSEACFADYLFRQDYIRFKLSSFSKDEKNKVKIWENIRCQGTQSTET